MKCLKAICIILDSESYPFLGVDIIYDKVKVIVEHFKSLLLANNCSINHLKEELEVLHDDIIRYISKSSSERCWPIIFPIGHDLGIHNLLHILGSVLLLLYPVLSQRESSFLWCIFSKEQQSMKHDILEILLHIQSDVDLHEERYGDATDMFLNEYPDGTVRRRKLHLQGHRYPLCQLSKKKTLTMMQHQFYLAFHQMKRKNSHKLMLQRMYH